jgi:5'-3' exonuclease
LVLYLLIALQQQMHLKGQLLLCFSHIDANRKWYHPLHTLAPSTSTDDSTKITSLFILCLLNNVMSKKEQK